MGPLRIPLRDPAPHQVSTVGLEEAAQYLLAVCKGLAEEAARSRPDLVVEAAIEKVGDCEQGAD